MTASACGADHTSRLAVLRPSSVRRSRRPRRARCREHYLVVADIEAARAELAAHGAEISEVFHFGRRGPAPCRRHEGSRQRAGTRPASYSYRSWASFSDPDGNSWMLQEIKTRLPGRGLSSFDVETLTQLLRETEEHHGAYEATAPKHHWSGWYAAYIVARQQGRTPEDAAKDAALHMESVRR